MQQRLALDQLTRYFYCVGVITGCFVVLSCAGRPPLIAPELLGPIESAKVHAWVAEMVPRAPIRYGLRWSFENQKGSAHGRAAVHLIPPDSLRFDYRAPFGRSGAAVVFGDSLVWSEPEQELDQLFEFAALFWAAIGIPRAPPAGWQIRGDETAERRAWQYVRGADTVSYVVAAPPTRRLRAEARLGDQVIGTVDVAYSDSTGWPASAVMFFPSSAASFRFTVLEVGAIDSLDENVWKRP